MLNAIEYTVETYREGRQWKLVLRLPGWIIDDILNDLEAGTQTVVIARAETEGGMSAWAGNIPHIMGLVKFEAFGKPKDE